MGAWKAGSKEVKYIFLSKKYSNLILSLQLLSWFWEGDNAAKTKITAALSHLLGLVLLGFFFGFFCLFWCGFLYIENLTDTDKFLAFARATLQEQSKYKKHVSIMTNAMESSEKKTLQGKTCLEEWWQCSNHNLLKPKGIVNFSSFIFCWSERFSVLSTSWHEEDTKAAWNHTFTKRIFESSFLRCDC